MFDDFVVQPIFNLLVFITALIPGHNFGLAIIIFTIIIRLLLWPLVKKQLHHAKAIRELQPELKKIKKGAAGDRQKEMQLTMELYKERQVNPFASIGIALVQIPILLGLFFAVRRIIEHPKDLVDFSYSFLHGLGWIKGLEADIHKFDSSLFGVVDLTRSAISNKGVYIAALLIVAASAVVQYIQSKQLMPQSKDARSLRAILREAGQGKTADQQEVSAAVGRGTLILIPLFVFIFGLSFPAALPLYWLVSSSVALVQQSRVLKQDVEEAEAVAEESPKVEPEKLARKTKRSSKRKARRRRKK
jgi:YidC/Oxa1 family membrane protein insertase